MVEVAAEEIFGQFVVAVTSGWLAFVDEGLLDQPAIERRALLLRDIGQRGQFVLIEGTREEGGVEHQPSFDLLMLGYPAQKIRHDIGSWVQLNGVLCVCGQQAQIERQATRELPDPVDLRGISNTSLLQIGARLLLREAIERERGDYILVKIGEPALRIVGERAFNGDASSN